MSKATPEARLNPEQISGYRKTNRMSSIYHEWTNNYIYGD